MWLFHWIAFVSVFCATSAAPLEVSSSAVSFPRTRTGKKLTPPEAVAFMKKFGYLEPGPPDSEALYTEEAVRGAIREVQKFGDIPQTGVLDDKTMKLLKTPRCGNPDVDNSSKNKRRRRRRSKRYVIGSEGWNKRTIRYYLANWTPKLNETSILSSLSRAFSAWSEYSDLSFVRTRSIIKSDITVAFGRRDHGDSYPFDGPGNVLAHAYFPYDFGDFGGDVHFDDDEAWVNQEPYAEGTDFFTVAVHELGHSLGLSHSPDRESIMFPYYKGAADAGNFHIGYDDVKAMYELYIQRYIGEGKEYDEDDVYEVDTTTVRSTTTTTRQTTTTTTTTSTSTTTTTTEDGYGDYQGDEADHGGEGHGGDDGGVVDVNKDDICSGGFDELAFIRGELFGFKGEMMWRYAGRGALRPEYPARFERMFGDFGDGVDNVDAAYERPDGNVVFFSGSRYWVFDGFSFVEGTPRPLTDLGLPSDLPRVDAAFVWGKNGREYVFAGDRYWRMDPRTGGRVEDGYPLLIRDRWRGVPDDVDSVFTWKSGITYFFKANLFWRFDDDNVVAEFHDDTPVSKFWLGCPSGS